MLRLACLCSGSSITGRHLSGGMLGVLPAGGEALTTTTATSWLAREQLRLSRDSPRTWSLLQLLLRRRVVVLFAIAGIGGGFAQQHTLGTSDTVLFTDAARQLLSAHGLDVFSNPALQVGPLYLLLLGALSLLAQVLFLPSAFVAGFVQAGLVTVLCVHLVRAFAGDGGGLPLRCETSGSA
jgi:hypothetical protein